jgi:acyl-coenzyme A thioesterase PaaI-like protein
VICDFALTRLHESYPGIVHGGVAAALLDEVMGSLLVHRERKVCFTTSLRTTFAGALRVGEPYRAVAWIAERPTERPAESAQLHLYKVHGEIRDAAGAALVIARGAFQWITAEIYARTVASGAAPEIAPLLRDHA